jgi:hypothetical protein
MAVSLIAYALIPPQVWLCSIPPLARSRSRVSGVMPLAIGAASAYFLL